jgi:cell division protease FtsH
VSRVRRGSLEALTKRLIEVESIDSTELKEIVERTSPGPLVVPGTDAPVRLAPPEPVTDTTLPLTKEKSG